ncbi:putative signal transduction protein with Nacht domain [Actinosynnema mirum DSM 43827]|uniref:Putative signal transduction protein with Nacht domain n=1 Tax=Actinosynnema mirum (strain ATCC 29888 / DSM 43827 / JCM 3225 / NBRC 14064 / NCIMB 13271 / NRRL B-12336 / IMRU 3971 / 101) TaxID=446462 RepID=C6WAG7_ACTMD|nr:putative signal transduction protein with Nacht domain [Actinosynnema mirum DSM 43827]
MHEDPRVVTGNTVSGIAQGPVAMVGTARDVYLNTSAPPPASPERHVRAWGDPVELPPAVVALLRAQVEERQDEQPRPVLDERGDWMEPKPPRVKRLAVRPPAKTVREALDGDRHLLVVGAAGQGKSTLSLRLASDIAACWLHDGQEHPLADPVLPLRVTARELAARRGLPFPEALAESLRAEYDFLLHAPPSAELLGRRVAGCPWLLLVDGLDEVADPADRERLVKSLALCAAESPYRVVLTSRPLDGSALAPLHRAGARRYELQPFDEEGLRRFAAKWFADDPEVAERFTREIDEANLGELVRVPLLATLAAIVFEQRGWRPLPDSRYEAYLEFLLSRRTPSAVFEQHRTPLLEHLGRVRVETDTSLTAAARRWAAGHVPAERLAGRWEDALTTFLASSGPLAARNGDLRWLHDGDREAHLLAARLLAMHLPTGADATAEFFATARLGDDQPVPEPETGVAGQQSDRAHRPPGLAARPDAEPARPVGHQSRGGQGAGRAVAGRAPGRGDRVPHRAGRRWDRSRGDQVGGRRGAVRGGSRPSDSGGTGIARRSGGPVRLRRAPPNGRRAAGCDGPGRQSRCRRLPAGGAGRPRDAPVRPGDSGYRPAGNRLRPPGEGRRGVPPSAERSRFARSGVG